MTRAEDVEAVLALLAADDAKAASANGNGNGTRPHSDDLEPVLDPATFMAPASVGEPVWSGRWDDTAGIVAGIMDPYFEGSAVSLRFALHAGLIWAAGPKVMTIQHGTRFPPLHNVLQVGYSANTHKGTTSGRAMDLLAAAVGDAMSGRCAITSVSTGQGLLAHMAGVNGTKRVADPDSRLLVYLSEAEQLFDRMTRSEHSAFLANTVQVAWDAPPSMQSAVLNGRYKVLRPWMCILGDITPSVLRSYLSQRIALSGVANRFELVWAPVVARMPNMADEPDTMMAEAVQLLKAAIIRCRKAAPLRRSAVLWALCEPWRERWDDEAATLEATGDPDSVARAGLMARRAPILARYVEGLSWTEHATEHGSDPEWLFATALAYTLYGVHSADFIFRNGVRAGVEGQVPAWKQAQVEAQSEVMAWIATRGGEWLSARDIARGAHIERAGTTTEDLLKHLGAECRSGRLETATERDLSNRERTVWRLR